MMRLASCVVLVVLLAGRPQSAQSVETTQNDNNNMKMAEELLNFGLKALQDGLEGGLDGGDIMEAIKTGDVNSLASRAAVQLLKSAVSGPLRDKTEKREVKSEKPEQENLENVILDTLTKRGTEATRQFINFMYDVYQFDKANVQDIVKAVTSPFIKRSSSKQKRWARKGQSPVRPSDRKDRGERSLLDSWPVSDVTKRAAYFMFPFLNPSPSPTYPRVQWGPDM